MKSTKVHSTALLAIINKEKRLGRMAKPFNNPLYSFLDVILWAFPKKDGGKLITNLFAPTCKNVNDYIDPASCSVLYASKQQVGSISLVRLLLYKLDLSNVLGYCKTSFFGFMSFELVYRRKILFQ